MIASKTPVSWPPWLFMQRRDEIREYVDENSGDPDVPPRPRVKFRANEIINHMKKDGTYRYDRSLLKSPRPFDWTENPMSGYIDREGIYWSIVAWREVNNKIEYLLRNMSYQEMNLDLYVLFSKEQVHPDIHSIFLHSDAKKLGNLASQNRKAEEFKDVDLVAWNSGNRDLFTPSEDWSNFTYDVNSFEESDPRLNQLLNNVFALTQWIDNSRTWEPLSVIANIIGLRTLLNLWPKVIIKMMVKWKKLQSRVDMEGKKVGPFHPMGIITSNMDALHLSRKQ